MADQDGPSFGHAQFFTAEMQNKALTKKEGRPIYETKRFVKITHPGDKHFSVIHEVSEDGFEILAENPNEEMDFIPRKCFAEMWPREWAAFKRGEERAVIGTTLDEWGMIPRSRALELKALGIRTVEEYADVQDNMLPKLGWGAREEREKARAFLKASKDGAGSAAMAARIAELEAIVAQIGMPSDKAPAAEAKPRKRATKPAEEPVASDAEAAA